MQSLAAGDLRLRRSELVDCFPPLGFELGEVLLIGVLVLDVCGVVGDGVLHHSGGGIDRSALLQGLVLKLRGVAEGVPADQGAPLEQLGEGGLEDLFELLVV